MAIPMRKPNEELEAKVDKLCDEYVSKAEEAGVEPTLDREDVKNLFKTMRDSLYECLRHDMGPEMAKAVLDAPNDGTYTATMMTQRNKVIASLLSDDEGRARQYEPFQIQIIACDFDGCLATKAPWPLVGEPILSTIAKLRKRMDQGAKFILWTGREGEPLDAAVEACKRWGIPPDAVNENLHEEIKVKVEWQNPRKVFATEYWDDKAYPMGEAPFKTVRQSPFLYYILELMVAYKISPEEVLEQLYKELED